MLRRLVPLAAATGLLSTLGCNSSVSIGEQETDTEQPSSSDTPGDESGASSTSATSTSGSGQSTTPATTTTDATSGPIEGSSSGTEGTTGDVDDDSGPGESDLTGEQTTGPSGEGLVLFINFDGPTLTHGTDDATTDVTQIAQLAMDLEAYSGSAAERAEIVAVVEEDFAGINITITDERPAEGEYTMALVTPTSALPGAAGIAPLDCDNSQPSSVLAAFSAPQGTPLSPAEIGATVSRETGFALGLEAVEDDDALMTGGFVVGSAFVTECTPSSGETVCTHLGCDAGSQNSFAELAARANE